MSRPFAVRLPSYNAIAILCTILWSSAGLATKAGIAFCPPLTYMALRYAIAGVILWAAATLMGRRGPKSLAGYGRLCVLGIMTNALYMGLGSWAFKSISVGVSSVLSSTNSISLALGGALFFAEKLTRRSVTGMLLALGGVVVVMWVRMGEDNRPAGIALAMLANFVMVASNLLFKKWQQHCDLLISHGVQMMAGAVALTPAVLLLERNQPVQWTGMFVFWLLYLVVMISFGAMLIWLYLLREGTAVRAGAFLFLIPVFGVVQGRLFMNEPLGVLDALGAAMVAIGVWVANRRQRRQAQQVKTAA